MSATFKHIVTQLMFSEISKRAFIMSMKVKAFTAPKSLEEYNKMINGHKL